MDAKYRLLSLVIILVFPFILGSSNVRDNQAENRFSLYNYTVFEPGSFVSVNLFTSSNETKKFHFRLLKIDDPLKFISLSNRNNLRYNFDIWGKDGEALLEYTKQIKEWDTVFIKTNANYTNRIVSAGKIDEPGTYILQAFYGRQVAYCGISVSSLAMIYKNSDKQILSMVIDAKSGIADKDVKFSLFEDGKLISINTSGKDGISLFNIKDSASLKNNILLMAEAGGETIFSDPYFFISQGSKSSIAYIYTNQPVYRPGQQVYFKAIFRDKNSDELVNVPGKDFSVKIKSPKNIEIYNDTIKTDEFGTLSGSVKLDNDTDLGQYSIQVSSGGNYFTGSFEVQEYKKPEYAVKVETVKKQYASGDTVNVAVSADYYFGAPVTQGIVELKIYKQNIWRPWWYWSEYSWFYKSFAQNNYMPFMNRQLINQQSGKLDKNGRFNYTYKIEDDHSADYIYIFEAEVTDNSRSTVSGSAQINVTRGSFTLSTSPDRRSLNGGAVDIRVNASDFENKPIQTKFSVAVNYPLQNESYGRSYMPMSDTLYAATDKFGRAIITFLPRRYYPGNYNYIVTAYDEKGRKITAQSNFFIGEGNQYDQSGEQFEILTDKDTYEAGDSLTAYIFLPQGNADILITYEANSFLGYEVKHAEGGSTTIKLKLTGKYSPSFNISAAYIKDRKLYTATKMVGVLDKSKFLNIAMEPSKKNYKPGEEASYNIKVTDNNGKPVKNTELSAGVVDESIYAIKQDETPDIKSFFYSPGYSNIPAYSSLNNIYYRGSSRIMTLADEKQSLKDVSPEGSGSITGKLETIKGKVKFGNIYVLLSSNSYYYKSTVDTSGIYSFDKIKEGKYDLLALLDNGDIITAGNISVGKNSSKDINLGSYENTISSISNFPDNNRLDILRENRVLKLSELGSPQRIIQAIAVQKPEQFVKAPVRKEFADAAFWKADIVTDKNGKALISFKMPDNLTTWRTTIRGITKNSEVGQNTGTVITKKNLLVRLEAPRFFREGDEMTVSTIVHNYLSESKLVKVSFNPGSLKLTGSRISSLENNSGSTKLNWNEEKKHSYEIKVDKDSEVRIDWKIKADEPIGEAKLKAEALTNEESDAVEIKVPILPEGIKKIEPVTADYSDDGTKVLTFDIPSKVDIRTAKLSFSAAPSLAGTILKALDDLAGYPYGCVEQTMSRFLPTIIAANTFKEIGAPLNSKTIEELPKMVDAGMNRLYNFQHGDGGWGWWTNDQTNPYMTAYVIYGMSLAKEAGYKIDTTNYHNGINNLTAQIDNYGNLDFTTRVYMLYSLSIALKLNRQNEGQIKKKASSLLYEKLNPYALSLLALTFNNLNEPYLVNQVLDQIKKLEVDENGYTYWGGKTWHYSWQDDKVQTTAFAIKALMLDKNNRGLVTKAVRWLLIQKQGFSWRSTQETASVIFGITDYLRETKELNPDFNLEVYVNNKKEFEKKFTRKDVYTNSPTIVISGINKLLTTGKNEIKIVKTGEGKIYFSCMNEYYSPDTKPSADRDNFIVTREYYLLKPEDRGDKIIYVKQKLDGKVKSGRIILVQTQVETKEKDLQYFILEDMLPSGFEAVKDENNFQIEDANKESKVSSNIYRPYPWYYADKEYYDSKVSFLVTNVQSKMYFSYMIQAQMPGSFNVMPAQGYLMYYPEVNGNSNSKKITVSE